MIFLSLVLLDVLNMDILFGLDVLFVCLLIHFPYHLVVAFKPGHLKLIIAILQELMINLFILFSIVSNSLFFNVPVGLIKIHLDEICSKITEKQIVEIGVKSHALELNIIIYFICYFEIILGNVQLFILEYSSTFYD